MFVLPWVLLAPVAVAHHSAAMFDTQRHVTLTGTVREFQFTNPHCFIQLLVPNAQGLPEEWSIEMGAPAHLMRDGWKPHTLNPGDKITVTIFPTRDGSKGGNFESAVDTSGKPIGATS